MRTPFAFGGLVGLIVLTGATSIPAAVQGLDRVASGLANPMFVTHAPGDSSRLFIAQRGGQIRILDLTTGVLQITPFLSTTVDTSGEGGLLGLAFHPNYSNAGMPGFGKFYVDVTTGSPFTIRVREFEVSASNPNLANAGSLREIVSIPHTAATNHNGGWIGFSPNDNYLYVATGDGGGGNDDGPGHTPGTGNAQDTTNNLLGKMLRIDVNSDDFPLDSARNYAIPPTNPFKAGVGIPGDDVGDDEIWGYGLRNPFRAALIGRPATCGSAMWDKASARKSTFSPPIAMAPRTMAGGCARDSFRRPASAAPNRPITSIPSTITTATTISLAGPW